MVEKSNDYLRLSLAVAALLVGASVAYHYVIYIPEKDREQQAAEQTKEQSVAQQQLAQQDAQQKAAQARKSNYEMCVASAQFDYSNRWDATCKTRSDAAEKNRLQCLQSGMTVEFCQASYPPLPPKDCQLPSSVSDSYDSMLKDNRQHCLDEAKADVLDAP